MSPPDDLEANARDQINADMNLWLAATLEEMAERLLLIAQKARSTNPKEGPHV